MFLGLLWWEYTRLRHSFIWVRSLFRAQVLHCNCGVFGPVVWEHARAGLGFMWVRSLPRVQVLHRKCGGFGLYKWEHARLGHGFRRTELLLISQVLRCKSGCFKPVLVGACGAQASLHTGEELAQCSGSPLQIRCFWACSGGGMRGSGMASCG